MKDYASVGEVAEWCGVATSTVSKWQERFPKKVPQPDVRVGRRLRRRPIYGWDYNRRGAWLMFAAGMRDGSVADVDLVVGDVSIAEAEAALAVLAAVTEMAG